MALTIIGVGEAGVSALGAQAKASIRAGQLIIAAPRFHDGVMAVKPGATIENWPSPFSDIYDLIAARHGQNIVVLATGDPMWFGAGASLIAHFGAEECEVMPGVSGFQMAAARMGWPLSGCETLTVHGRPVNALIPRLYPRGRLLVIGQDETTPAKIAALLCEHGYGQSQMSVLASVGGDQEQRFDITANAVGDQIFPPFHIIAIACPANAPRESVVVLPDSAFENDGKLTKRDVRASAIAKLAPFPGAVMWDVGSGSGAVAIDFLRNAPRGKAFAIDRNADQIAMAERNALQNGVVSLHSVAVDVAAANAALTDLPQPDAIFIGGGLSAQVIEQCQAALRPGGVLVAHAVTLESEQTLMGVWQATGGAMARLSMHHADPVGAFHGWRPLMPVTQLCWHKTMDEGSNGQR